LLDSLIQERLKRAERGKGGAQEEGEAPAQAAGGPPEDLSKLENLQEDLG
jgi:hypothetical protein